MDIHVQVCGYTYSTHFGKILRSMNVQTSTVLLCCNKVQQTGWLRTKDILLLHNSGSSTGHGVGRDALSLKTSEESFAAFSEFLKVCQ